MNTFLTQENIGKDIQVQWNIRWQSHSVADGVLYKVSPKAFCVKVNDNRSRQTRFYWFPLSAINSDYDNIIYIKNWFSPTPFVLDWSPRETEEFVSQPDLRAFTLN